MSVRKANDYPLVRRLRIHGLYFLLAAEHKQRGVHERGSGTRGLGMFSAKQSTTEQSAMIRNDLPSVSITTIQLINYRVLFTRSA
jgi:hypothetical protein